MIFIRSAILVSVFFYSSLNFIEAQTLDSIFDSIVYNGIAEKKGLMISLTDPSSSDDVKIPLMLFSNRTTEIEKSRDSVLLHSDDIILFDIIFGEPFLVYSNFFERTGIMKDSFYLRINALKDFSDQKVKELKCKPYAVNIYSIYAFIIEFEIEQSKVKRYLNKMNIIPIYSELKTIHVGILIDEKSELARLLRKINN